MHAAAFSALQQQPRHADSCSTSGLCLLLNCCSLSLGAPHSRSRRKHHGPGTGSSYVHRRALRQHAGGPESEPAFADLLRCGARPSRGKVAVHARTKHNARFGTSRLDLDDPPDAGGDGQRQGQPPDAEKQPEKAARQPPDAQKQPKKAAPQPSDSEKQPERAGSQKEPRRKRTPAHKRIGRPKEPKQASAVKAWEGWASSSGDYELAGSADASRRSKQATVAAATAAAAAATKAAGSHAATTAAANAAESHAGTASEVSAEEAFWKNLQTGPAPSRNSIKSERKGDEASPQRHDEASSELREPSGEHLNGTAGARGGASTADRLQFRSESRDSPQLGGESRDSSQLRGESRDSSQLKGESRDSSQLGGSNQKGSLEASSTGRRRRHGREKGKRRDEASRELKMESGRASHSSSSGGEGGDSDAASSSRSERELPAAVGGAWAFAGSSTRAAQNPRLDDRLRDSAERIRRRVRTPGVIRSGDRGFSRSIELCRVMGLTDASYFSPKSLEPCDERGFLAGGVLCFDYDEHGNMLVLLTKQDSWDRDTQMSRRKFNTLGSGLNPPPTRLLQRDYQGWNMPGGKRLSHEMKPEETAYREMYEETAGLLKACDLGERLGIMWVPTARYCLLFHRLRGFRDLPRRLELHTEQGLPHAGPRDTLQLGWIPLAVLGSSRVRRHHFLVHMLNSSQLLPALRLEQKLHWELMGITEPVPWPDIEFLRRQDKNRRPGTAPERTAVQRAASGQPPPQEDKFLQLRAQAAAELERRAKEASQDAIAAAEASMQLGSKADSGTEAPSRPGSSEHVPSSGESESPSPPEPEASPQAPNSALGASSTHPEPPGPLHDASARHDDSSLHRAGLLQQSGDDGAWKEIDTWFGFDDGPDVDDDDLEEEDGPGHGSSATTAEHRAEQDSSEAGAEGAAGGGSHSSREGAAGSTSGDASGEDFSLRTADGSAGAVREESTRVPLKPPDTAAFAAQDSEAAATELPGPTVGIPEDADEEAARLAALRSLVEGYSAELPRRGGEAESQAEARDEHESISPTAHMGADAEEGGDVGAVLRGSSTSVDVPDQEGTSTHAALHHEPLKGGVALEECGGEAAAHADGVDGAEESEEGAGSLEAQDLALGAGSSDVVEDVAMEKAAGERAEESGARNTDAAEVSSEDGRTVEGVADGLADGASDGASGAEDPRDAANEAEAEVAGPRPLDDTLLWAMAIPELATDLESARELTADSALPSIPELAADAALPSPEDLGAYLERHFPEPAFDPDRLAANEAKLAAVNAALYDFVRPMRKSAMLQSTADGDFIPLNSEQHAKLESAERDLGTSVSGNSLAEAVEDLGLSSGLSSHNLLAGPAPSLECPRLSSQDLVAEPPPSSGGSSRDDSGLSSHVSALSSSRPRIRRSWRASYDEPKLSWENIEVVISTIALGSISNEPPERWGGEFDTLAERAALEGVDDAQLGLVLETLLYRKALLDWIRVVALAVLTGHVWLLRVLALGFLTWDNFPKTPEDHRYAAAAQRRALARLSEPEHPIYLMKNANWARTVCMTPAVDPVVQRRVLEALNDFYDCKQWGIISTEELKAQMAPIDSALGELVSDLRADQPQKRPKKPGKKPKTPEDKSKGFGGGAAGKPKK